MKIKRKRIELILPYVETFSLFWAIFFYVIMDIKHLTSLSKQHQKEL